MFKKGNRELTYEEMQGQYLVARRNLLLMLILTAVNIVLYFTGSDTMMLFSATVPYYGVVFGTMFAWRQVIFIAGIAIAVISLLAYLACWFFSKKRYEWMIGALVLFVIDTIAMMGLYIWAGEVSGFLDVLIHAWVLYYLFIGVKYGYKLKHMPVVEETAEQSEMPIVEEVEEQHKEEIF